MKVAFNGFNEQTATFETSGTVNAGEPVMISDNGTVSAANGAFCGICVGTRAGYAAVQLGGYIRVPYSGTLSVGFAPLVGNSGKIKSDSTNGRNILVVDVDTTNHYAGIIL